MIEEIRNATTAVIYLYIIALSLPENCKLKRVAKKGVIKGKIPTRAIQALSINECLKFDENNEIIEDFILTLEAKFSHCDLSSFYRNIKKLKIITRDKTLLEKLAELLKEKNVGDYTVGKNKIKVFKDEHDSENEKRNTINHELLHMASSRKGLLKSFCGFNKEIAGFEIGRGLNEGYTQVLNNRYFVREKYDRAYEKLQMIAIGIEQLVGPDKMQQLYFTNDLEGLIKELEKYATREEILSVLIKIDKLNTISPKNERKIRKKESLASEIRTDIANMKIKHIKSLKSEGIIDEEGFIDAIFEQELYARGYIRHYLGFTNGQESFVLSQYPYDNYGVNDPMISVEEYKVLAGKYYQSKKDNLQITCDEMIDENGLVSQSKRETNITSTKR